MRGDDRLVLQDRGAVAVHRSDRACPAFGGARTNRSSTAGRTTALGSGALLLVGRPHRHRWPVLVAARNWRRRFGGPWWRCGGLAHYHRWFGGGFGRRPAGGLLRRAVAGLGTQRLGRPRWSGSWRAGGLGRRFGDWLWCWFGGAGGLRRGLGHHLRFAAGRRARGRFGRAGGLGRWFGDDFWFAAGRSRRGGSR